MIVISMSMCSVTSSLRMYQVKTTARMGRHLALLVVAVLVVYLRDYVERSPLSVSIFGPAEAILLPVSFSV